MVGVGFGLTGIMLLFLLGCAGSGLGDDPQSASDGEKYLCQALLGPIVGATIDVYRATDISFGTLCTVTTVDDPNIDLSGFMDIPADCVEDDGFYLLVTQGGEDIDPDDDGIRDPIPSRVNGKLHALFTRDQIQTGKAKITAVTEVTYQYTRYLLSAGYGDMEIEEALSQVARIILTADISGDGSIDYLDLAAWHPRLHRSLFRPGLERLNLIAGLILDGFDPHAASLEAIPNITLGVKQDFPEFIQSSWVRTHGDSVVIDGRPHQFQTNQDGSLTYDVDYSAYYHISSFGDYRAMTLTHNNLEITAHLKDIEILEGGNWRIASPPRIEITDIYTGNELSSMELTGDPVGMKIIENHLYLLRDEGDYLEPGGLDVIDLSDPEHPALLTSAALQKGGQEWVFRGNEVTILEEPGGRLQGSAIHVFDVSSAGNLNETFNYILESQDLLSKLRASTKGVLLWNRFDPKSLTLIDRKTAQQQEIDLESEIIDFDLDNSNIYVLTVDFGLRIIDAALGQPRALSPVIQWTLPTGGESIDLIGDELWVLQGFVQHSNVVGMADRESPEIISELFGCSDAIEIDDNHVLVAWASAGMRLYERTFAGWVLERVFDTFSWCLARNDDYAFGASIELIEVDAYTYYAGNGRLDIFDLNPAQFDMPYHQLIFDHDAQFDDIAIEQGHVYLVDAHTDIFQIVDIHIPDQAFSKSIINAGGTDVLIAGQHAYVASLRNGIRLIDISDPVSPQLIHTFPTTDARDLAILHGRLYLADGAGGLKVFDVKDDGTLSYISTALHTEQINAVEADGDWVWVSTDSNLYALHSVIQDVP